MKEISLNKGQVALVDDSDFEWLNAFTWTAQPSWKNGTFYAAGRSGPNATKILMHREVMGARPGDPHIDHINRNPLDNRRENLRYATSANNNANKGVMKTNTSGYKGVSFYKDRQMFVAQIKVNYKSIKIGSFKTAIEAAKAYNEAAKRLFGEFAYLNPLPE
jgi:hypothetical protein